ncbi:MAG: 50S ribosomal protein L9 [Deltaproteobacteria bacterium]|nr:50S ribosomal protein L9 [Deltaproteobacteria bacterium]
MKVILREVVERLGQPGDVVTVADGFARNYLIPRGLVRKATFAGLKDREHHMKQLELKRQKLLKEGEELVDKLQACKITLAKKVGEEDRLYGSVTTQEIAEALLAQGVQFDRKHIVLDTPIKALGVYDVKAKVDPGLTAILKVWVVSENGE